MEVNKLNLESRILELNSAIRNSTESLINWEFENKLISFDVNNIFEKFIELLIEPYIEEVDSEEAINEVISVFIEDILMYWLLESYNQITSKCIENKDIFNNQYSDSAVELFISDIQLSELINKIIRLLKLESKEKELTQLLDNNSYFINQIPKALVPYYLFVIVSTYREKGNLQYRENKNLTLKTLRVPQNKKMLIIADIQKQFSSFNAILNFLVADPKYSKEINHSLNYFAFNKTTNLIDLYSGINTFSNKFPPNIIYKKLLKIDNKVDNIKPNKVYKFNVSNMVITDALGLKNLLINEYYYRSTFNIKNLWITINTLFDACKQSFIDSFMEYNKIEELNCECYLQLIKFISINPYPNIMENTVDDFTKEFKPSKDIYNQFEYENFIRIYQDFYKVKKI